ncbi:MAG TPA: hypothetical protein VFQ53_12525 [Kofleriaceae bacterium]|nr:hypothetical protein [Kofleriaceae bacterium]
MIAALFALQQAFEDLVVRGLRSSGPDDVRRLQAIGEDFGRAGAGYIADLVGKLVHLVREADSEAPRALLRAQTAMRVFERVLSLDAAVEALAGEHGGDAAATEPAREPPPLPDKKALVPVLEELAGLVEGLVGSGLTTASAATKQKLDASFKEASRLKLLRLATSLRYVGDELARFLAESEHFSARRLAFFLNRTWLISRGLLEAIAEDDRPALARLLLASAPQPVKSLKLAMIGVQKRALLDGSAAFEFRFRTLADDSGIPRGTRLVWSCVFGAKKGVPAEAFLHLPQAQKFTPKILLDAKQLVVTDAAVALDDAGGRLMLGPKSTVTQGAPVAITPELVHWDPKRAVERIRRHRISPLDLEVELQEEIVVEGWELGAPGDNPFRPEQRVFPVRAGGLELDAVVSSGPDGETLGAALNAFRREAKQGPPRPPLFGLVHYEMGRLVFQPLTALAPTGPVHLMISNDKIDLASLMKTMDFTS